MPMAKELGRNNRNLAKVRFLGLVVAVDLGRVTAMSAAKCNYNSVTTFM